MIILADLWENLVIGMARLWLYLTYGMDVETYYERLACGPEIHDPPPYSISGIIPTSTDTEPPLEPSPPMDYYPVIDAD